MEDQSQPVVRAANLMQRYKDVIALADVSLDIPAGKVVGLIGPDGVGKSTLLDLIAGARVMQTGMLQVLGGDMRKAGHRQRIGPRLAYMPQGLGKNLYQDLSVQENLDFFGKLFGQSRAERNRRIARLTRATGLFPFLDRPAGKLSGGMKQKLGLCCALLHDPDLLILDEPTTGVDPLSRRQFWDLIAKIRQEHPGMSLLVSTAYMEEAEEFDWLVAMDAGQVLATGTAEELRARTGTDSLEAAFVRLRPGGEGRELPELVIPPLQTDGERPAIVARGLTRRFGDFTAVSNVSFEIRPGEIFGFLGSNGCGKTTTMKMLTGLLPMSEGEAYLFGKPVNAKDLATRKRVGFMSQAFSLYGELTVAQNLALHARLFQIPSQQATARIAALADRFELSHVMDTRSGGLPLGIRQRLSLAVAVLHEPEILILDEPTSGVDPEARDRFWEFLIELSRRDKVTIFISTHFMNEALRCDRISLMHAGEVLVHDTPDNLVEAKGATSLEDAFVAYIEDATGEGESADSVALQDGAVPDAHDPPVRLGRFSLSRLLAYSLRETVEVIRDPIRLAFAFLGSVILLVVLSYGVSMDVEDLTFAALDQDQSPASRSYLSSFTGSRYFLEQPDLLNREDLIRQMAAGEVSVAVEIPPNFGRDLARGNTPEVSAWLDGANTMRAGTVEGYITGGHAIYLRDLMLEAGVDPQEQSSFTIENRYRYNPTFASIRSMGPSIPAMLLMLFPVILMAVSVAREKEIGTITNFYVTPTNRIEFLVGKQLPYVAIAMCNYLVLTLMVIFVLDVPLKGSLSAMTLGALCYGFAVTAYGLVVSSLVKTQVAAVFAAALLSLMPTMQYSGMIQPISTLSPEAQMIGSAWPASYFMHLSVGAYTKGLGWAALSQDIVKLSLFFPVFLAIAVLLLRKQEK